MATTPDSQQLILAMQRYVDGDADSFDTLYEALGPVVQRGHARWSGRETAADLTQQTFLKIHRGRKGYRSGEPVTPWVMTIARRVSIDSLRKRGRGREHLTAQGELPARPVPPAVEARDTQRHVQHALRSLSDGQRQVVELHHLQGHGFAEVATRLGIQENAARVRASRAYANLRRILSPAAAA
jgi:RNA polymerase sigma-70 factor, ECF subfamily